MMIANFLLYTGSYFVWYGFNLVPRLAREIIKYSHGPQGELSFLHTPITELYNAIWDTYQTLISWNVAHDFP